MKGRVEPYGDVDVVVSIVDDAGDAAGDGGGDGGDAGDRRKVALGVHALLGGREGPRRSGATHSLATAPERHQVDLLFCRPDRLDFLAAVKGNNDFAAFLGHILKYACPSLSLSLSLET